jgi:hypothetical protein
VYKFPSKIEVPPPDCGALPGDLVTRSVCVLGTKYKIGHIVVTEIVCEDILEVGVIERIVIRGTAVLFLVSVYECAMNRFRVFEALPKNKRTLIPYTDCADYKPLMKRSMGDFFHFVLHHRFPSIHRYSMMSE